MIYSVLPIGGTIQALTNVSRLDKHPKLILERSFVVNCYPNKTTFNQLVVQTGLDKEKVRSWFRHKRWNTGKGEGIQSFVSVFVCNKSNELYMK